MDDNNRQQPAKKCSNCLLCLHTWLGLECSVTDNRVDDEQPGCIDHIFDDDYDE